MIRTVKKPVRTRVRKRGQNDEYSRGSRSSRNTRYEIRADLCPFDGTGYIYSTCSSGYDFPETDPFEVYPIFLRLYAVCSAGSTDISGCIYLHRTSLFGGGTIVAVILGYKGKSLVVVAIAAIVTVYLLEMAGGAGLLASLSF